MSMIGEFLQRIPKLIATVKQFPRSLDSAAGSIFRPSSFRGNILYGSEQEHGEAVLMIYRIHSGLLGKSLVLSQRFLVEFKSASFTTDTMPVLHDCRSLGNYGADQVCAVKMIGLQNHRCGAEVRSVSGRASALVEHCQIKKLMQGMVSRLDSCGGKKVSFVTPHTITVSINCGSLTPIVRDLQPGLSLLPFNCDISTGGTMVYKAIAPETLSDIGVIQNLPPPVLAPGPMGPVTQVFPNATAGPKADLPPDLGRIQRSGFGFEFAWRKITSNRIYLTIIIAATGFVTILLCSGTCWLCHWWCTVGRHRPIHAIPSTSPVPARRLADSPPSRRDTPKYHPKIKQRRRFSLPSSSSDAEAPIQMETFGPSHAHAARYKHAPSNEGRLPRSDSAYSVRLPRPDSTYSMY